jgi:hypothetical protein
MDVFVPSHYSDPEQFLDWNPEVRELPINHAPLKRPYKKNRGWWHNILDNNIFFITGFVVIERTLSTVNPIFSGFQKVNNSFITSHLDVAGEHHTDAVEKYKATAEEYHELLEYIFRNRH